MIDFLQNFHFLRPWVLLFLILPMYLYFKKIGLENKNSSWENICDTNLLKYLLVHKSSQKKISITHYLYIGIISIIIAAAGPTWKKIEIPTLTIENPNMFVLSLSQDMQLKDVTPSRLERAKFIISDLAEDVEEGQFGLEVYSQEPYIITPLTDDTKLIKNLLPQIVANIVPDQGDRLDRAIDLAIERFKSANYTNGNILIFASDVGQRFDLVISKIEKAVQSNFAITVIDMSYSENDKLRMLSEKANGFYFSARNGNIKELIQHLKLKRQEKMTISENLRSTFIDYGYYLVFIALFCMLPFFRRGLLVLFLSVLFSSPAFAGFWTNSNQDGFNLFQSGNYEKASQTFKDPLWKGISLYKQDKKEEALATFSQIKNKNALYNSGVVLTKLCQYEKALDAFNKTLEIDPEHRDALYNKKVLEDLFEKAKTDPSVLNCGENKQKDNQDNNKNENKEQNQQNSQNNDQSAQSDNNNNQEQDSQKQDNQQENNQEKGSQNNKEEQANSNQDQSSAEQKNEENNHKQEQNSQESANQQQNSSSNENQESSSQQNSNQEQNNQEKNQPAEATNDNGSEQNSKNNPGEKNNATEQQEEEVEASVVNAKKGDENNTYDEEALAIQRRYREIPEDVGGLLREFIKKEYMKDRYRDENN